MGLAIVALVGAVAAGYALGGSWSRLTTLHLRRRRFVVAAVVAQSGGALVGVVGAADPRASYVWGLALSAVCAALFCLRNLRVAGVPLVTVGLLLNAVVVGLNGAMPVSIEAALRASIPIADIAAGNDPRHELAGDGTTLRLLGDVIPVPLPARAEVVSPGDVLVAAGLAELVAMGMLRRRPARARRDDRVGAGRDEMLGARPEE